MYFRKNGFPRFVTRPPGVSRHPLEELLLQLEDLELCGGGNDPVGPTDALSAGFLAWGRGVIPRECGQPPDTGG